MPAEFTDVIAGLCPQLGIDRLAAVVGISGAGPTAVTLAARHPDLVERLILLLSAVGWVPWPTRRIRIGSYLGFNAWVEPATWSLVRAMLRVAPDLGLRVLLRGLSTLPAQQAFAALSEPDRTALLAVCRRLRSGSGFLNDLHPMPDVCGEVTQPTLVFACPIGATTMIQVLIGTRRRPRGDRLVFSNGSVILAALAGVLIWLFDASTSRLIQLYIVGRSIPATSS